MARGSRDIERIYSTREVVAKLRRLADALEADKPFRIQIGGVRIRVPERAQFSIEHERDDDEEEIEFQLKWSLDPEAAAESEDDSPGGLVNGTTSPRAWPSPPRWHGQADRYAVPWLAELTTWLTGRDSCTL